MIRLNISVIHVLNSLLLKKRCKNVPLSFEKKKPLFEIFFYFLSLLFYTIWFLCCSHRVLTISRGLDEVGGLNWQLTLCFLGAWLVVFLCLIKGVKSLGKVCWHNASIELILLNHY